MSCKKKRHLGPRRKRMTRQARLESAKITGWVEKYEGKNIIKGYSNWFAVDLLCASTELRMLGVTIAPERENQIRASIEARAAARKRRKEAAAGSELDESFPDSDHTFAHIAGCTPGGVPFGVTWEEHEEPRWCDEEETVHFGRIGKLSPF